MTVQREHMELLNRVQGGARYSGAGSSSSDCRASPNSSSSPSSDKACRPGSGSSNSSPSAARPAVPVARVAADPAAALHKMHTNLQALKVRKQRVTGAAPLSDLQQQAESASERLLLAKLQEAGRIMEEQETVSWGDTNTNSSCTAAQPPDIHKLVFSSQFSDVVPMPAGSQCDKPLPSLQVHKMRICSRRIGCSRPSKQHSQRHAPCLNANLPFTLLQALALALKAISASKEQHN